MGLAMKKQTRIIFSFLCITISRVSADGQVNLEIFSSNKIPKICLLPRTVLEFDWLFVDFDHSRLRGKFLWFWPKAAMGTPCSLREKEPPGIPPERGNGATGRCCTNMVRNVAWGGKSGLSRQAPRFVARQTKALLRDMLLP
jgi:hypothetical protein